MTITILIHQLMNFIILLYLIIRFECMRTHVSINHKTTQGRGQKSMLEHNGTSDNFPTN